MVSDTLFGSLSLPFFERYVRRYDPRTDRHLPRPLAEERVTEHYLELAGRQARDLERAVGPRDGEERVVEHVDRRRHPRVYVAPHRELLGPGERHFARVA